MNRRITEAVVLGVLAALMVALALADAKSPPSTYSTYDTGPSGYRALYDVLLCERIPVNRLEASLGQLPPDARVLAATPELPTFGEQLPIAYDQADVKRLRKLLGRGRTVVAFASIPGLTHARGLHILNAADYTNAALAHNPRRALDVYAIVVGRGPVYFDERLHGYDRTKSLWHVLPTAVRIATVLAIVAVLLGLVDANVRFAPPVSVDPPSDRDSSDYVISMARLLRRAHAGRAAIERFARAYPDDLELQALVRQPSDASVLRAAIVYNQRRKDRR